MAKSDYHPVHKAEEDDNQNVGSRRASARMEEDEEIPLLPEERCCCSALQCLVTPPIFIACICACSMFYGAAYVATG